MKKRAQATKKTTTKRAVKKAKRVAPIPPGFHTVTPTLVLRDGVKAIDFYKKAFGAKEVSRMMGPNGMLAHAELRIGNSPIMIGDEMPAMGASAPQTIGGTAVHIFLYVPDVDKVFAQAVKAGATIELPVADMFWGDRFGKLLDPFGHKWSVATHTEDLTPKEMAKRAEAAMSQQ
jgi:PhnB protein